jgi:hypothetical protein
MRKLLFFLTVATTTLLLTQCKSTKPVAALAKLTYEKDIQPLMSANCSPCHFPERGKVKFLNTYTAVSSSIDDIVTRIQLHPGEKGFMPFKRARLSDSTINVFKQWKADGLLEK